VFVTGKPVRFTNAFSCGAAFESTTPPPV